MSATFIENGRIESTSLGTEDHGIFTAYLSLTFDGSGQAFGGWALDSFDKVRKERIGTAFGCAWIMEVLRVLEVTKWERLPGTPIRVRRDNSRVYAIGHYLRDRWFEPEINLAFLMVIA